MVKTMVNKYENTILTLNKWAWIVSLIIGAISLIYGIYWAAVLAGPYYVGAYGVWYIIGGIIGIAAGVIGKMKVVSPIDAKNFEATSMMLLIVAIIGLVGNGAGFMFLIQFILIKVGGT
ncbi:MAG: hypothetical protein RBG13Loki_3456 [Promethearchaeota archaeon CR_4]|nr:MAG: hypothetical protein RBG13Loki_3456 [Candidatus Lokiarchaeota archaeon CR_4]